MVDDQVVEKLKRLDPNSDEFKRLLLKTTEGSDHPNDMAIARILRRELTGYGESLGGMLEKAEKIEKNVPVYIINKIQALLLDDLLEVTRDEP
jgi:hypothetical protein